jgi:hypothetical protein
MKARYLKKLLNNTGYIVADHGEYIGVGSPLCHNLIAVDKATMKITYALDTWHEGRKSLKDKEELGQIWDTLAALIASGEMRSIMDENDVLDNPVPIWFWDSGTNTVVERQTEPDSFAWPAVAHDGTQIYDNSGFRTRAEAVACGVRNLRARIESLTERIVEKRAELKEKEDWLAEAEAALAGLLPEYVEKKEGDDD